MKIWIPVVIFLLAFGLYLNTLSHGFVFDDTTLISQNPQVKQLKWADIVSGRSYRPVRTLTYAVNYALGGEDAFGYHLFNVMFHAFNAVLVYLLFWTWTSSNILAGSGALLFLAHPVQTAAVAYISGRKDLLATFFVLLGCYLYALYRKKNRRFLVFLSLFFFLLGILCKEVVIVFPGLLVLFDILLWRTGTPGSQAERLLLQTLKKSPFFYGLSVLIALLAAYYAIFLTQASRMVGLWGGSLVTHLGTCFKLFVHYLKLVLVPYPLIADYTGEVFPISKGFLEPSTLLAVAVVSGYLILTGWACRRNPRLAFGLLWFLLALLPVLQIVPFHKIAADHFLYFPAVGMAFLGGWATEYLARSKGVGILAWGLVGLTSLVFAGVTVDRNHDWANEQSLWAATIKMAPDSYRANTNLGMIYQSQGRSELAIRHTKRSLELDPNRGLPWNNLGAIYHDLAEKANLEGKPQKAAILAEERIRSLEKSIALDSTDPFAFGNLGTCFKQLGLAMELTGETEKALQHRKTAVRHFQKALRMPSDKEVFPVLWFNLGMVFFDAGYYDQAVDYLKNFVVPFPDNMLGQYWMGVSYFRQKKYAEGIPYLEKACALQPKLDSWGMLAKSYEELGENGKSIQTYLRAMRQFPNSAEVHYNLGVLYHRVGEGKRALEHLERALQLSPDDPLVLNIRTMMDAIIRDVSKS